MDKSRSIVAWMLVLALATSVNAETPPPMPLSGAATPQAPILDVVIDHEGLVQGRLTAAEGAPIAGAEVRLTAPTGEAAIARTNRAGRFAFRGATGVCVVDSAHASMVCRVWSEDAAPPSDIRVHLRLSVARFRQGAISSRPGAASKPFRSLTKRAASAPSTTRWS